MAKGTVPFRYTGVVDVFVPHLGVVKRDGVYEVPEHLAARCERSMSWEPVETGKPAVKDRPTIKRKA